MPWVSLLFLHFTMARAPCHRLGTMLVEFVVPISTDGGFVLPTWLPDTAAPRFINPSPSWWIVDTPGPDQHPGNQFTVGLRLDLICYSLPRCLLIACFFIRYGYRPPIISYA
ncbi:hypothetical protein B0H63DRAFT_240342 [Podospora didyma]|uniref:Secreted protein n=1 Tax=Podospora didyma TaxID=330526 RepID=A0AAE0NCB9_9PEZI|nr:hypothetical protein B0H63DRAFT_240342 [Podospora didyma]